MNGPHKTLSIVRRSERKRVCTPANFGSPRAFNTCEGSATPLVTISLTAACGLSWANALKQSSMNCSVLNMRVLLESVLRYYIVRPQQRIRKNTVIREALREIAGFRLLSYHQNKIAATYAMVQLESDSSKRPSWRMLQMLCEDTHRSDNRLLHSLIPPIPFLHNLYEPDAEGQQ